MTAPTLVDLVRTVNQTTHRFLAQEATRKAVAQYRREQTPAYWAEFYDSWTAYQTTADVLARLTSEALEPMDPIAYATLYAKHRKDKP